MTSSTIVATSGNICQRTFSFVFTKCTHNEKKGLGVFLHSLGLLYSRYLIPAPSKSEGLLNVHPMSPIVPASL